MILAEIFLGVFFKLSLILELILILLTTTATFLSFFSCWVFQLCCCCFQVRYVLLTSLWSFTSLFHVATSCYVLLTSLWSLTSLFLVAVSSFLPKMWPQSSPVYQWWVVSGKIEVVEWPECSPAFQWWEISGRLESGSEWPLNQRNFWRWFHENSKDCVVCTSERIPVRMPYVLKRRHNLEDWMVVCVRCKRTL